MRFSDCIKKNNAPHLVQVAFVYWSVFDRKIKMETNAMNMRSQIMICIKLKLVPKRFMRMPQTQNSQAGWIKFKCNDSSWEQPLHILGMMKWMIDGAESGKIFKTLLICCVLGKYDASYSCLFCCSYETFETDFPICEIFISNLNLRNYNNETYQTLQISFLNYLFINKAKLWDLCIIIISSFSILIAFRIMPNDWTVWWAQRDPAKCANFF